MVTRQHDKSADMPRSEYPRPQFVRADWLCLNGRWQFEIDVGNSGLERGLRDRELSGSIVVPFCPESKLSEVGNTDFLNAVWYRRGVQIPKKWAGQRLLLHFQAVDEEATVWVNGQEVARHRGGWTPFTAEISDVVKAGDTATIVVRARDDMRRPKPRGKQATAFANNGCDYTRTTGIWQTVWLEPVPQTYLKRCRITPDLPNAAFHLDQPVCGNTTRMSARATLLSGDTELARITTALNGSSSGRMTLQVPEGHVRPWSPAAPFLYKLRLELLNHDASVVDTVESYAGLRSISIDGKAVKLNGETLFQRLVLDQGFYSDGILTAPSDEALIQDITLSIEAGFNGARLHQKVFEERFLYHADRLGYLCWGEFPDWGMWGNDVLHDNQPGAAAAAQWLEELERDYSHPSIIGWCPLNETRQPMTDRHAALNDITAAMFLATKAMDITRPVIDASGYAHRMPETDIYDSHNYEQDPQKFQEQLAGLAEGKPYINLTDERPMSCGYRGQPYFISEFGGTWWCDEAPKGASWGYGQRAGSRAEAQNRIEALMKVLLDNPDMFGYCYTQLTDVFQEMNGLYTFDRRPKFDLAHIRAVQQSPAAIERKR